VGGGGVVGGADAGEVLADECGEVVVGVGECGGGSEPAGGRGAEVMEGVLQAAEQPECVAAEDAGVGVGLVEHDQSEVGEAAA